MRLRSALLVGASLVLGGVLGFFLVESGIFAIVILLGTGIGGTTPLLALVVRIGHVCDGSTGPI